jgi:TonB-linked SusC/RagA family outer membrane protein
MRAFLPGGKPMSRSRWTLSALAFLAVGFVRIAHAQGTITGRITSEGNLPLGDVRVLVISTAVSAITNEDGKYTLKGVPAGTFDIQALHVGFQSQKKSVNVAAGSSTVADFVLKQAIVQLEEVVTTATGQQRKVELGNAISTLGNVAKKVEETPVMAMQDLLVAKAPGVNVLSGSVVGAAPTIRVRGVSSINLSNAPIWVVDGVRYNIDQSAASAGQTPISLINNLSPEEIEDIEIVRGPSAATLYGTNAANGVIVVTTKKGRAGSTRWNFSAETRTIDDRNPYQAQYANWGHTPAAPTKNIRCQLYVMQTSAFKISDGATCLSDSVTSYNYLTDPEQTFIKLGRGSLFSAQVSGGTDAVRFFTNATLDNEFGPIQMPAADIRWYDDTLHVPVTNSMLHPRQQQKLNFRSNISAQLSPKLDLTANAGFGKSNNILEPDNSLIIGLLYVGQASYGWKGCPKGMELTGCGMTGADSKQYYDATGFPLHDSNGFAPGSIMQYVWTDEVQRFTGSTQLNWRPLTWMQNEGTVGIDWSSQNQFHVCRLNECPNQGATSRVGNVYTQNDGRRNFSAKIASTASWQFRPAINLKTSVGSEYTNLENDQTFDQGRTLAPGASTLNATSTFVSFGHREPTAVKTLGYYLQEQIGLRDRMFLTVAGRQDQNSAFGTKFQHITYPKVSLSWLLSDEPFFPQFSWLSSVRLRSAYGANGVQPRPTDALQTFSASTQTITKVDQQTGVDLPGLAANQPGNSSLRPEKSAEFETGFEADFFNRRIHLDYTWYQKNTTDALIALPIPASVASPVLSLQQNVGKTQNWGNEVQASAVLVDSRRFGWDVTVSASHNANAWVDLGKDPSKCTTDSSGNSVCQDLVIGAGTTTQQRKGDPLFMQWYRGYTYADDNGDGIIQQREVHVSDTLSKIGVGFAKDLASIQTGFDLFSRRLRLSALFDYRAGGNTLEGNYFQCSSAPKACRDSQDPTAPLWMQARAVAITYGSRVNNTTFTTRLGYFVPSQFWKWRELAASYILPDRINRMFIAQKGSTFVFGLRNIHTWTNFTGVDPEQNYGVNGNEIANDFNTSPPPTYITFRLNLKY